MATIPVQKTCCDARTRPGCLRCVKKYYAKSKKKSFGGCGCDSNKYKLAKDLWMVRDALGASKCPNDCSAVFDTTSECYRHALGFHENPDKNCPESYTTCPIDGCSSKFKRKYMEDHLYLHECLYCYVCRIPKPRTEFVRHIKDHAMNALKHTVKIHEHHPSELRNFKRDVEDDWISNDAMNGLKNYIKDMLK